MVLAISTILWQYKSIGFLGPVTATSTIHAIDIISCDMRQESDKDMAIS